MGEVTTPHSHRVTPREVSNTRCVKCGGGWGWRSGQRLQLLPADIESLPMKSQTPEHQLRKGDDGVGGGGRRLHVLCTSVESLPVVITV